MGPLFVSAKVIVYSSPISKILLVAIPISKTGISAKLLIAFPYQQNVSKMQAIVLPRFPTKTNKSMSYITVQNDGILFLYFTLAYLGVLLGPSLFENRDSSIRGVLVLDEYSIEERETWKAWYS